MIVTFFTRRWLRAWWLLSGSGSKFQSTNAGKRVLLLKNCRHKKCSQAALKTPSRHVSVTARAKRQLLVDASLPGRTSPCFLDRWLLFAAGVSFSSVNVLDYPPLREGIKTFS